MGTGEVSDHPRQRPEPIGAVERCRPPHIATVSAVRSIVSFVKAFALKTSPSTTLTRATRACILLWHGRWTLSQIAGGAITCRLRM